MLEAKYDVVILGAGAAGIAAAITAAEQDQSVALIDRSPYPGGELVSGLPILGAMNARGEGISPGILSTLLTELDAVGGYVGRYFDYRTMWGHCIDSELMKLVVADRLGQSGIALNLGTVALDIVRDRDNRVDGIIISGPREARLLRARSFVDASGDAWIVERLGLQFQDRVETSELQPVSLTFKMAPVDYPKFLQYVAQNPQDCIVGENPILSMSDEECVRLLADQGVPFVALGSHRKGNRLSQAIESEEMFPTTAFYMWPTSRSRNEVGLNVTRISGFDGSNPEQVSAALPGLSNQVQNAARFLTTKVPGFEFASISAVAPRIGIRETNRIMGESTLTTEAVVAAEKSEVGIARGGHHIDIHGSGRYQLRKYIQNGGSYDIPYGALVPTGTPNVIVAGRCVSSTREANGSARVMGTCLAMGEAAGAATALLDKSSTEAFRDIMPSSLREMLARRNALASPESN